MIRSDHLLSRSSKTGSRVFHGVSRPETRTLKKQALLSGSPGQQISGDWSWLRPPQNLGRSCLTLRCQPAKTNAPARTGAGALSWMAGRLIATILENLEPAGAAADQVDDHSLFGISVFDRVAELFGTPDALVVYFRDHIAAFDSAAFGRAVGFHFGDDHAIGHFHAILFDQVACQRSDRNAEV